MAMNLQEWFYFVTHHLTDEQVAGLSQADPSARRKYVLSEIRTPRDKSTSSSLEECLRALTTAAQGFWQSRLQELGDSESPEKYRLLLDGAYASHAPSDLRRLGIFFDQVLYPCPIHEVCSIYTQRGFAVNQHNLAVLGLRLGGFLAARDLFDATKISPLFDVAPLSVDLDEIIKNAGEHAQYLFQNLILHVEALSFGALKAAITEFPEEILRQLVRDNQLIDEIIFQMQKHHETVDVSEVIGEASDGSLQVRPIVRANPSAWNTKERLQNLAFLLPELVRSASTNALIGQDTVADVMHTPALVH